VIPVLLGLITLALLGEGSLRLFRAFGWIGPWAGSAVGNRLLLSTASVPWLVAGFDLAGIPITRTTMGVAALVLAACGLAAERCLGPGARKADTAEAGGATRRRGSGKPGRYAGGCAAAGPGGIAPARRVRGLAGILHSILTAPAASVLTAATAALLLFSVVQFAIVPERNYDALVGYDLVGKIMAQEGRYLSTVFTRINYNAQCVYPPYTAANNGFWYLYHPEGWKLWVPVSVAGFLLVYFGFIRRWSGSRTAAALASFVLFLPTALLFQLTEAQTDMPSMLFIALALMCTLDGLAARRALPKGSFAWITLLLLFATTGRSENVLFGLGLALSVLILGQGRRWMASLFFVVPAAFFAFWNLFYVRQLMGYDPAAHFLDRVYFDTGRMADVLRLAGVIIADPGTFGEFVWVIALLPVLWFAGSLPVVRDRLGTGGLPDYTGLILSTSAVLFLLYMPFFYMWDPELNPLWTMEHTFKRGFFRFIPGLLAAFVCSPPVLWVLRRCESR